MFGWPVFLCLTQYLSECARRPRRGHRLKSSDQPAWHLNPSVPQSVWATGRRDQGRQQTRQPLQLLKMRAITLPEHHRTPCCASLCVCRCLWGKSGLRKVGRHDRTFLETRKMFRRQVSHEDLTEKDAKCIDPTSRAQQNAQKKNK